MTTWNPPHTDANPSILIVSNHPDDAGRSAFMDRLADEGIDSTHRRSGSDAVAFLEEQLADMLMVDADLPDRTGVALCGTVRARWNLPILVVDHTEERRARLESFRAGADDYVPLPIDLEELTARVRALLRRSGYALQRESLFADLLGPDGVLLEQAARRAFVGESELTLTRTEFELLRDLLRRRGVVRAADDLSMSVWGYETHNERNYIEAHISRLRRKLGSAGAPTVIDTVRGVGYVIR